MYQIVVLKSNKRIKTYDRVYESLKKANSAIPAIVRNWKKRDPFVDVRIKRKGG
jgi:hypothetical protein